MNLKCHQCQAVTEKKKNRFESCGRCHSLNVTPTTAQITYTPKDRQRVIKMGRRMSRIVRRAAA